MSFYRTTGKRLVDLVLALPALLLAAPLLIGLALVAALTIGRPVLFRQQRPGLKGEPFWILKFRTMTDARDSSGNLLPDDRRLHPMGRFMRQWSLDELPELLNVVRGDMSLVGPRPLLMSYLERYSPEQMQRHEVLPGITGWAQVNGRNALSWQEKFDLDLFYVQRVGLLLDLRILLKTAALVLTGQGISAPGHVTMPEFKGNDK